jgi:hypothetical protein
MLRRNLNRLTLFALTAVFVQAQPPRPADRPEFVVASIKPSNPSPGLNDEAHLVLMENSSRQVFG